MHGLAIYGSVLLVAAWSWLVGQAVLRVSGFAQGSPVAGAVGALLLIALADDTIRLPGAGLTAIGIWALVAGLSLWVLGGKVAPPSREAVGVLLFIALLTSLPFLANGRFGFVGNGIVDDMAAHGTWAEGLRTGNSLLLAGTPLGPTSPLGDYPSGGHALAGVMASLTATTAQYSFDAELILIPALTGVAALEAMAGLGAWRRWIAGVLAGVPFLIAAHLSRANFKEPIVAMALLAFTLLLRQGSLRRPRAGVALGLLIAATAESDGLTVVAWFAAIAVFCALAHVMCTRPDIRRVLKDTIWALVATGSIAIVAMLPEATHLLGFSANTSGGGFPNLVSMRSLLGPWIAPQLTVPPPNNSLGVLLSAMAVVAAVGSLIWWLRRHDWLIPAGAAASFLMYLVVRHQASPYIATKALAEASPLVMVTIVRPLLSTGPAIGRARVIRPALWLAAAIFVVSSGWSSVTVLREANVGSHAQDDDLSRVRTIIKGKPTLFLGVENFFTWKLRGARLLNDAGPEPFPLRPGTTVADLMDVDAVAPEWLAKADYVLQTRSEFTSTMPGNWRLVATTLLYELWQRTGPESEREVVEPGSSYGTTLDCHTPAGRRISRLPGYALVRTPPVIGTGWVTAAGVPLPASTLPAGSTAYERLALPAGRWKLSLQYQSSVGLVVRSPGVRASLSSDLDPAGPYWPAGEASSNGQWITFSLTADRPPLPISSRSAYLGAFVATRADAPPRMVPLSRACGAYVDWYQPDSP
jgi:hypothetical protein